MKLLHEKKRLKALFVIVIFAIGIGAISKKVISYPSGECYQESPELTFNN